MHNVLCLHVEFIITGNTKCLKMDTGADNCNCSILFYYNTTNPTAINSKS